MDEFYHSLTKELFYRWIILNEEEYKKHHVQILKAEEFKSRVVYFESEDKFGRIIIWDNNLIEEQLFRKKDGSSAFYLHFEIACIGQCRYLFNEFYQCLIKKSSGRRFKVLICCSGGFTSSLFASKLQELVEIKSYNIRVESVAFSYLSDHLSTYDMVFLAPQVAHQLASVKKYVSNDIPVRKINPTEYATLSLDYTFYQMCDQAIAKGMLH